MLNISKISTFVGFSVRSGQILYGADTLIASRKHVKLILLCSSLTSSSEDKVRSFAQSKNIPVLKITELLLEDIVHKKNCKVIGLLNKNLAQAVLDSAQSGQSN